MLLGPDQFVSCPACSQLARYQTLKSGNTFGARRWSDGRMRAPMLPSPPQVVRCTRCGTCAWLADLPRVDRASRSKETPTEWAAAPHVEEPGEAEYYQAIEAGLGGPDREFRLRLLAWWRSNDPFRDGRTTAAESGDMTEARRSNLERLASLLGAETSDEALMKTEVLRELGRFAEALQVLGEVRAGDHAEIVALFREWCEAGDSSLKTL